MKGKKYMNNLKKLIIFFSLIIIVGLTVGCYGVVTTSTTTESITTNITTSLTTDIMTQITTDLTTQITSETTTASSIYLGIDVSEVRKAEYNLNESFDESSITVELVLSSGQRVTLRSDTYDISGFDSSTSGDKEITVTHGEYTDTFTITVLKSTDVDITMTYYLSAEGLSGTELVNALRTIVNTGFVYKSYDDARYILNESDADPNNPSNVILIYTGWSVSGVWDAGATWNREHVWPQSLLGYDTAMSADLHNLKPSNPGTNSSRGNKYYDYITDTDSYEPRDEVKGDVARILLYMTIKWDTLTLVDTVPSTYEMALLSVLLEWHELDPVDDFERNRNEVIYSYQNNRNPFIDYPEFVDLIWG
jgi:endonuclease I